MARRGAGQSAPCGERSAFGRRARLSRSRQQNVVLLVNVAVEILLEGLQRVEERSVGVAERGLAIVVAAQHPQRGERVPERRVLRFVLSSICSSTRLPVCSEAMQAGNSTFSSLARCGSNSLRISLNRR